MISIETEARVAKLLLTLAQGERNVEISRQVLSDNFDFDAYQIFKVLDRECKNRVDAVNLVDFLRNKGVFVNDCEAQFVILFYDQDGDGALSYCEFVHLVQSEKSLKRSNAYQQQADRLSFNVDYSLGKLLEKEVNLVRELHALLSDLRTRCDFNVHDIYHLLKSWNCITASSLSAFLDKNCVSYLESDINAMMKRLDFNRDGRVDICELHAFLGFPNCSRCCPCSLSCSCKCCSCCCCCTPSCTVTHVRHCSPPRCRSRSPLRCSNSIHHHHHCSPLRCANTKPLGNSMSTSNINSSTNVQSGSPLRQTQTQLAERRLSPNLSLRMSPERRFSPNRNCSPRNSPLRASYTTNINTFKPNNTCSLSTTCPNVQNQFLDYLRMIMDAEGRIEIMKTDLALQNDFNVEDAFRIFELDGRGFLTEDDLKYGLNMLGVYPTPSEVHLLMKRFDLGKSGVMNYADFFDMVTPYEKDYRNMVECRPPNSCCACRCPDVFLLSTRTYLKNLFNALIDYENKFNLTKRNYASVRCQLRDLFRLVDKYGLGYFNENDLANYLKNNYAFTTTKDADLLFIRLDRNRNGKVELNELEEEFACCY